MSELRFDGQVVLVTGAGRNLGREYALALAAHGARVVVNDLGVGISDSDGDAAAPSTNPALDVVQEIRAAGGEAVANTESVATSAGGRAIVECALDTYGRIDAVVNNAGQVRMGDFATLPDESIDALLDTQLRGPLNVSRPAWAYMGTHGGGRIVNVSSGSAFGGVPGGSAYGMTKMGTIGLTRGMAFEGKPHNIIVNVIVPYAKTRPGTGFGPWPWSEELGEWLSPHLVAPLVTYLCHESCAVSGEILSVGAGHVARVGLDLTDGFVDREATASEIAERITDICTGPAKAMNLGGRSVLPTMMRGFDSGSVRPQAG
jgi:NAD(P)-dependent dehydrogenase (short-subunit alcohol dehydrogenase family)